MILPLMASSITELATFSLAIDDVNRLQLSFTCFLSFTFFISMLTEKLPHNSSNMPLLLITVSVMAGSVCLITVLQAITYNLTNQPKGISKCQYKMTSKQCRKVAHAIDQFGIVFYISVILVCHIAIPAYIYLSSQRAKV